MTTESTAAISPNSAPFQTYGSTQPSPRHPDQDLKHTRPRVHLAYLPPHVDQQQLSELFGATAALTSVKILESRVPGGLNYGFVEFADMQAAQAVVQTFDGYTGFGSPIRVSWAKASNRAPPFTNISSTTAREQYASPPTHHANVAHVFVGDLAPNVDDPMLESFFKTFPSLNDVRVMYDPETGKSRGFGFISFRDVQDAERCIATMKGEWLAGRPVRVNWANQKNHHRIDNTVDNSSSNTLDGQVRTGFHNTDNNGKDKVYGHARGAPSGSGSVPHVRPSGAVEGFVGHPTAPAPPMWSPAVRYSADGSFANTSGPVPVGASPGLSADTAPSQPFVAPFSSFADVLAAAPSPTMSTVYIGNMPLGTTAEELVQLLGGFGYVLDVRIPALPSPVALSPSTTKRKPERETGYAFIKMDSHQSAANAIFSLSVNGAMVRGRPVRLGWEIQRDPAKMPTAPAPGVANTATLQNPNPRTVFAHPVPPAHLSPSQTLLPQQVQQQAMYAAQPSFPGFGPQTGQASTRAPNLTTLTSATLPVATYSYDPTQTPPSAGLGVPQDGRPPS